MQQVRYATVLFSAALAQAVAAQSTTLDAGRNIPAQGRVDHVVTAASYTPAAPGGTAQTYDLSALVGAGTADWQWLDPAALPHGSMFPGAMLALTDGGTDTLYYKETSSGFERTGEHEQLLGLYTVDAPYSDGPLELKLPLAYGDTWNDAITATFAIDQSTTAVRSGTITGNADASGWIILPGSSTPIEVLRVRTYVNETITVPLTTITHHRHVDAYYASFSKYPVFRSYADSLTTPFGVNQFTAGTEWLANTSLGVADVAAPQTGMLLAPNPTDGAVDLSWTGNGGNAVLEVFNATGAMVLTRELGFRSAGPQRAHIDGDGWAPGLYLVRLRDGRNTTVKRLTVR